MKADRSDRSLSRRATAGASAGCAAAAQQIHRVPGVIAEERLELVGRPERAEDVRRPQALEAPDQPDDPDAPPGHLGDAANSRHAQPLQFRLIHHDGTRLGQQRAHPGRQVADDAQGSRLQPRSDDAADLGASLAACASS